MFCRFIPTAEYVAEHLDRQLGRKTVRSPRSPAPCPSPAHRADRRSWPRPPAETGARHVLVATDCLSEGVNLQDHFHAVVHYDLAWNPTRHEQREGRVDRFGQRRADVRAVTLYGADNGIDGMVLDVLIRKHREIRKATGISVPVPDETSAAVTDAVVEWLLRRDKATGSQQALFDLDEITGQQALDLDAEWNSMAERERRSRSRYAQGSIHPDDVAREVTATRAALGSDDEIRVLHPHRAARARRDLTGPADGDFTVTTASSRPGCGTASPRSPASGRADPVPHSTRRATRRGSTHPHRPDRRRRRALRPVRRPRHGRPRPVPPRPALRRHPHRRRRPGHHAAAGPLPLPAHPARPSRRPAAHRRGRPRARLRGSARLARTGCPTTSRGAAGRPARTPTPPPSSPRPRSAGSSTACPR